MIKNDIRNSVFYRVNVGALITACAMSLLSVGDNDSFSDRGNAMTVGDTAAFISRDDHPALKPLDNPTPSIDKDDAKKSIAVNKEIKLEEDQLYSPMNVFGAKENGRRINDGLYKLIPQERYGVGDNFTAEQIIDYANLDKASGDPFGKSSIHGAAMGLDPAENKKPVIYLTQGNSPYTVWKAIDGEQKLYKAAEFDNPLLPKTGQCFNSSTAMAPNGTLWFTNALDKAKDLDGNNQGKVVISMLDPQGTDAQGKNRLIKSVDSAGRTTVVNPMDPKDTGLEGQCLRAGVFDTDGFYYARIGVGGRNTSDDILRFDLSEFPSKVTYTRLKFDINRFGAGLAWHGSKWWSAPIFDEVLRTPLDPKKERPEEIYAFNVDPETAHKTLIDIPNFRDGYPMIPINNLVSTEFVPPIRLGVEYSVDKDEAARGDTMRYTVKINNKNGGGGLWYTGEAFVDLAGLLDSVDELNVEDSSAEVVDSEGNLLDSGQIRKSGTRLVWSGTIPLEGSLVWRYQAKIKFDAKNNRVLNTVVATSQGWESDCPVDDDVARAECQAQVTVRDSDVHIKKTQELDSLGPQGVVYYEVTAVNEGDKPYDGGILDDLSDVLHKAQYGNDATSNIGEAPEFSSPLLRWTGRIEPGESLSIRYSVRISPESLGKG